MLAKVRNIKQYRHKLESIQKQKDKNARFQEELFRVYEQRQNGLDIIVKMATLN